MKIIYLFLILSTPVFSEDWKIKETIYHNVIVGKVDADKVHITFNGGIGSIYLADLSPDLKKKFNYDPIKAQAAAQAEANRIAAIDKENAAINIQKAKIAKLVIIQVQEPKKSLKMPEEQSGLTVRQRTNIEANIASLQEDIAFMQKDMNKLRADGRTLKINGAKYGSSTYAQRILDEQTQIIALQQQLK